MTEEHPGDQPNFDEEFARIIANFPATVESDDGAVEINDGAGSQTESAIAQRFFATKMKGRFLRVIFSTRIHDWYSYDPATGLWTPCTDESLIELAQNYYMTCLLDARRTLLRVAGTEDHRQLRGGRGRQQPQQGVELSQEVEAAVNSIELYTRMLSLSRLSATIRLTRGKCQVDPKIFDRHPHMLHCKNGVVNQRTGELLPHSPTHFISKTTGINYIPNAKHEVADSLLNALTEDKRLWMQSRVAQGSLVGQPSDEMLVVNKGNGSDGKSSLFLAIKNALGSYAGYVSNKILLGKSDAHPTEIMDLRDVRLAIMEEFPEGHYINAERLKLLIGTPEINARRMHRDPEVFKSIHTPFVNTNYDLLVGETDGGTWRRLALLKWPYRYVQDESLVTCDTDRVGISNLKDIINNDVSVSEAILAWIIEGCIAYFERGEKTLPMPQSVANDTLAWRLTSDSMYGYITERIRFDDPESIITIADIHLDFNAWRLSPNSGMKAWNQGRIIARFVDHELTRPYGLIVKVFKTKSQAKNVSRPGVVACLVSGTSAASHGITATTFKGIKGIRFARHDEMDDETI